MHTAATWMATQAARRPPDLAASGCPGPGAALAGAGAQPAFGRLGEEHDQGRAQPAHPAIGRLGCRTRLRASGCADV